jgi:mono/diheme cytochrome c family protein
MRWTCVSVRIAAGAILGWVSLTAAARLSDEQREQLPAAVARSVDFSREIRPILEARCVKCHGRGQSKGGFSLADRAALVKGGDSGPAILPGRSAESYLVELVSGLDPDNVMPLKGTRLTSEEVALVRGWIDQGASWATNVAFAKATPINLSPRRPPLPPAKRGLSHPIDRILEPYYQTNAFKPPKPASDRVYVRRVYLDAIGLLPAPEQVDVFLKDSRPDKRERLVRALLADRRHYADHWLSFWNDALRNDYQGTGYIDEGRKQITGWLYAALLNNLPFDQFVRELVNPQGGSVGFIQGIAWRGVVNASQTPPMQAAQNIAQVFMGVNLKCASCHDSFINDWTLADAYGLAGIYADGPLEMVHCDRPTGRIASPKFLYPELGTVDPNAPKPERLTQLAALLTSEKNARLSRTIVNRLWTRLMGRGLVEPLDDLETPSWNPDLLDWLASDLAGNGFDLKRTLELILTSKAYQLPACPAAESGSQNYVFRGPQVRRMSAEQYLDALSAVTGNWNPLPAAEAELEGVPAEVISGPLRVSPQWIWNSPDAAERVPPQTLYFRKEVRLEGPPREAALAISCDNQFRLLVNGHEIGSGSDWNKPRVWDIRPHLRSGDNLLAIEAVNKPAQTDQPSADQTSAAGLLVYARIRLGETGANRGTPQLQELVTDGSWRWSAVKAADWDQPGGSGDGWQPAVALGGADRAPWKLARRFSGAIAAAAMIGNVRAALVNNDPLMTVLGRPNREQVVTSRSTVTTTLQALEFSNGPRLAGLIERGASRILERAGGSATETLNLIYERALSRKPSREESRLASSLIGSPAQPDGVADVLWAIAVLPEFQLID